ncbi:MAG: permease-like cell division protein FtsX [Floccifex sp.]
MKWLYLFLYEMKHAFIKIRRHGILCFSSAMAVFVSVFLVSICLIAGFHVDSFSHNIESDVRIHVVLQTDIDQSQIEEIQNQIQAISNVDTIEFSSKDDELELMIQEKGEAFELYRGEENPLAHAFFVTVKDGSQIEKTSREIENMEVVSSCVYGGSSVTQLMEMLQKVRKVGYGTALLLIFLSLYLIYNTIRTTIYSQQSEIAIMRTVGATQSFIKIPFELQGIFIGLLGSGLTFVLIYFGYQKIYEILGGNLFIRLLSLIEPSVLYQQIGWIILLLGIGIGWLASSMAVSKYVRKNR